MAIHADPSAIRDASKSIEDLLIIIATLKLAVGIHDKPVRRGSDSQAVERSTRKLVALCAKQLRKQLETAGEKYVDIGAASIRTEADRRPVSAHDLVYEAAIQIDSLVHCIWPELQASRTPKSVTKSSKFFAKLSRPLSSIVGIAPGELYADRDRTIGKAGDDKPKKCAVAKVPTSNQLARVRKAKSNAGPGADYKRILAVLKGDNTEGKGMREETLRAALRIISEERRKV